MNPFAENPRKLEDTFLDWSRLYVQPYDKHSVDPYTRTRVILMNGTEFEANWFSHQFPATAATTNCVARSPASAAANSSSKNSSVC